MTYVAFVAGLTKCLDDARVWLENEVYEPAEAVARFHHRLVSIHPFPNSNGRWSKVMADELLRQIDDDVFLDWSNAGSLQNENDHRRRYIDALRSADNYEFNPLIEFVASSMS